jgi:hypothetical protein
LRRRQPARFTRGFFRNLWGLPMKRDVDETPAAGLTGGLVELRTPPKPPLAFRVGIVGHRPNRLKQADLGRLGEVIRQTLVAVQEEVQTFACDHTGLFAGAACPVSSGPEAPGDGGKPATDAILLRAISPLAEGSDRIFAGQALDLGWELCCVMPFRQEEFENDFKPEVALEPDSLVRFHSLLERARQAGRLTRFQLDGRRTDGGAAYGAAGRVVLNQSDLLLVVWDGQREGKPGGTEETFDEARREGVPALWVDARSPHQVREVLPTAPSAESAAPVSGAGPAATREVIRRQVRQVLALPPTPSPREHLPPEEPPEAKLQRFYQETRPARTWAVVWKAFRDVVGDSRFPAIRTEVAPFEQAVLDEWPRDRRTPVAAMVDRLRPFYAWPDKLSVLCSDRYRSAFIVAFLLAAVAVAMTLLPVALRGGGIRVTEEVSTLLELAAIVVVLAVILRGRWRKWHERWVDYRLAAELLRHLRVVAPVGGARPFPQVPAHHSIYGHPAATWMDWYVRALARGIGLPDAVLDQDYLAGCLTHLEALLAGQLDYHKVNARRSQTIEHRLQTGVVFFLGLTLLACVLHVFHVLLPEHVLIFACGFFPALGAALAAINNQGEFRRVAKRSEAMKDQIHLLQTRVTDLQGRIASGPDDTLASDVRVLAGESARLLLHEVLDWRVVFLDRPLEVS